MGVIHVARVKLYVLITRIYFACKSTILHGFYACVKTVGAAIPVVSTVALIVNDSFTLNIAGIKLRRTACHLILVVTSEISMAATTVDEMWISVQNKVSDCLCGGRVTPL